MISCTRLYKELIKASRCGLRQTTNTASWYQKRKISWTITPVLASSLIYSLTAYFHPQSQLRVNSRVVLTVLQEPQHWIWAYSQTSPWLISTLVSSYTSSKRAKLLENILHWSHTSAINNHSLWHLPSISLKGSSKQLNNSNYSYSLQDSTQLSTDQEQL